MRAMKKLPHGLTQFVKVAEAGGSMYIPLLYILRDSEQFSDAFTDVLAIMETVGNNECQSGRTPTPSNNMSIIRIGGVLFTLLATQ